MHVLHKKLLDGGTEHCEFTRTTWEEAMRDSRIRSMWTHEPGRCHDDLAKITSQDQEKADAALAISCWPPGNPPMTPAILREMTGLSLDDCRQILLGVGGDPHDEEPAANAEGQFLLF